MIFIATADPLLTTGWMFFSGRAFLKLSIGNLTADPNTTAQRGTYGAVWADKKRPRQYHKAPPRPFFRVAN